jgi:hypothetical protein
MEPLIAVHYPEALSGVRETSSGERQSKNPASIVKRWNRGTVEPHISAYGIIKINFQDTIKT